MKENNASTLGDRDDSQIILARRRLLGAGVLAVLAVALLPVVFRGRSYSSSSQDKPLQLFVHNLVETDNMESDPHVVQPIQTVVIYPHDRSKNDASTESLSSSSDYHVPQLSTTRSPVGSDLRHHRTEHNGAPSSSVVHNSGHSKLGSAAAHNYPYKHDAGRLATQKVKNRSYSPSNNIKHVGNSFREREEKEV